MDMISTLPPTIIEVILCLVPIQEAARTSILSKEWRHHWTRIPKLVFEEDLFKVSSYGDEPSVLDETSKVIQSQRKWMTRRRKFCNAIYQALLKHEGPIHEFTLSMQPFGTRVEIDHILCYLSRNNAIKKLELNIHGGYKLLLLSYSLQHLTNLHLSRHYLNRQPTLSEYYDNLTNSSRDFVSTSRSTLLQLLSSCPSLKSLTLNIVFSQSIGDSTIIDLLECIPMVENLSIWLTGLLRFDQVGVPHVLPTTLSRLKYLHIDDMNFYHEYGLPFLLLLMRSSPNLEKLKLQIVDRYWFIKSKEEHSSAVKNSSSTLKNNSDIWLGHLKVLEVSNLRNENLRLDFMKLILARSPVLEKVMVFLWKDIGKDDELHVSRILLPSQQLSPMVEIIVERDG